jgi:thymidine kinase
MGYLKLILGPMFSGKSTKLLELIRKYKIINYKVMILKHSIDKRYSDADEIVSHNKDSEPCISLSSIFDVFTNSDWDILVSRLMGMGQNRLTNEEEALIRNITEKLL